MTTDEARIAPIVYNLSKKPMRLRQTIESSANTVHAGTDMRSGEHWRNTTTHTDTKIEMRIFWKSWVWEKNNPMLWTGSLWMLQRTEINDLCSIIETKIAYSLANRLWTHIGNNNNEFWEVKIKQTRFILFFSTQWSSLESHRFNPLTSNLKGSVLEQDLRNADVFLGHLRIWEW